MFKMPQKGDILGTYRLTDSLGRGGYAEVFLGENVQDSNRKAAIKILHSAHLSGPEVDKFKREAETIRKLNHPNIISLLDFDVESSIPFLVMDYAPNGTLRQRHRDGIPLPLATILPYVKQVADALQYVHNQKLIHRDVKPQNMLLGAKGEVLLSDFGIATVAHSQQSQHLNTRSILGTVEYVAPEQLQGNPTKASDQYSLGIVVYEWLCGQRPFSGHPNAVAIQQANLMPEPLRNKVPGISLALEQVVLKALAKDPTRRYPSVQEFADALEQAASQPVNPTASTSPYNATTIQNPRPFVSPPPKPKQQVAAQKKPPSFLQRLFAFNSRNLQKFNTREGRYLLLGGIGDIISSIVLGLTLQSWWVWLWTLLGSLLLRAWCAGLLRKEVATPLAVALAIYRATVGWSFESSITGVIHFGWLPPPGVVAIIFFIVSVYLNLRFARRK